MIALRKLTFDVGRGRRYSDASLVAGAHWYGSDTLAMTNSAPVAYDISSDGQRFLMIKEGGGTDQTAASPQIIVVQHWVEQLKRLVPAK